MKRLLVLISLTSTAHAHHGQDFFVTLDTRVPDLGHGSLFMAASWSKTAGSDETAIDPGFLAGIGGGFALGSSFGLSNETPGEFGYAGITPLLQWSIALPDPAFRLGLSASYHFADSSHGVSHSSLHQHGPTDTSGEGSNPDAPPDGGGNHTHSHGHHHHGGIHRHGEDHFQIRLLGEWQASSDTRIVANFIAVGGGSDDIDLGYSLGIRHDLSSKLAAGLEAIGDFNSKGSHEVIAGLYFSPRHDLTLRLGAGTGFGPYAPDISLHSGMTWRF